MSEQEAGWYPDPSGQNQERFWDGASWTEYYAPIVPTDEQEHGVATAREDYPYLAELSHRPDVMVAPGTPGDGWIANQPWGPAAKPRDDDGTKVFGAGVRGTPGGTAAVASLVVLAVMVVAGLGWWLVSGRDDSDGTDPSAPPTASPGSGAVVTGTFAADGETSESIETGGRYEGDLSLPEQSTLAIDVRGDGGAVDLRLTVLDEAGDEVYSSDDRGRELADMLDGTSLDPFGVPTLDAGEYTVVLEDVNGGATSFTATSAPITEEVSVGSPTTASVPADGAWIGVVHLAEEGEYTVDVRDNGSEDPVLATLDSEGRERVNDDRDYAADDYDPQVQAPMPSGPVVLVISEWGGSATSVTVSVTGPA